jgi:hypothetical protein
MHRRWILLKGIIFGSLITHHNIPSLCRLLRVWAITGCLFSLPVDFSDQSEALGGIKMEGIDTRKVPKEIQL